MLTIWGRSNSINVQKVLWACAELKLPYDRIDAGREFGVNTTPEYKAMNPNGLVPTIRDDGLVLWESHAIVRYLARKYGMGRLCPTDAQDAADADRWMEWAATTVWGPLRVLFLGLVRTPAAKRDMPVIEAAAAELNTTLAILDAHLEAREWVLGSTFSMGDIPLGCMIQRFMNIEVKRAKLPNVEAFYRRLQQRPEFKDTVDLLPLA